MAGGGKETPRQKMIGMMYLVLTALLAMNVSKDILMTFVIVNESMERSNVGFTNNNIKTMKGFEDAKNSNPMAVPYYLKAVEADKLTEELYQHIEKLKHELIAKTFKEPGGDTLRLRYLDMKDDVNTNTHDLIGPDEKNPATGEFTAVDLKNRIIAVHDKLLKMVQDMQKVKNTRFIKDDYDVLIKKIESLNPTTNGETEDGNPVSWEILNFYHNPIAGVITNLSKIQSDIKNVESELVSQFAGASGKVSVKFSQLAARVVAPSSYIQAGQPYKADIFIAASSSDFKAENMSIMIGVDSAAASKGATGTNTVAIVNGEGKYEVSSGVGQQSYDGIIKFKKPTGEYDYYPFHGDYVVAPPSVAVSADKMNVFYIGVPNPITVSAAGIAPGDLIVSGSGGGISLKPTGPGKYIVSATTETPKGQEAKISVSAKTKDGTKPQGPPALFRVKRIPDPVTAVGGKTGSADIKKIEIGSIGGILAKLVGFDFEANFVVISYEFTAVVKGNPIVATGNNNQLSPEMKAALGKVGTGSKVFIDAVKAKGPDGTIRNIPGVTLKVKG